MQQLEFNLFLFGTLFKGGKCLIKISIYEKFHFQMISEFCQAIFLMFVHNLLLAEDE